MKLRKAEKEALAALLEQGAETAEAVMFWVRFGSNVRVAEGACWEWTAQRTAQGYGTVHSPETRMPVPAHRHLYQALYGQLPEAEVLDHLCRNRACVNPAHLEPVSSRVNVLRGVGPSAINARLTHCKAGHPFAGSNLRIEANGRRRCVECSKRRSRDWREKQRATQEG